LDEYPELREEIKETISMYFESKARQAFALVKLTKCGAKLGLELIPSGLKADLSREVVSLFQEEISTIIAKGL